jgi:hypothetical protein
MKKEAPPGFTWWGFFFVSLSRGILQVVNDFLQHLDVILEDPESRIASLT